MVLDGASSITPPATPAQLDSPRVENSSARNNRVERQEPVRQPVKRVVPPTRIPAATPPLSPEVATKRRVFLAWKEVYMQGTCRLWVKCALDAKARVQWESTARTRALQRWQAWSRQRRQQRLLADLASHIFARRRKRAMFDLWRVSAAHHAAARVQHRQWLFKRLMRRWVWNARAARLDRLAEGRADQHHRRSVLARLFSRWQHRLSLAVYVSDLRVVARQRWRHTVLPRVFEAWRVALVRKQKREPVAARHYARLCVRRTFRAWRSALRRRRRKQQRRLRQLFRAWRAVAIRQRGEPMTSVPGFLALRRWMGRSLGVHVDAVLDDDQRPATRWKPTFTGPVVSLSRTSVRVRLRDAFRAWRATAVAAQRRRHFESHTVPAFARVSLAKRIFHAWRMEVRREVREREAADAVRLCLRYGRVHSAWRGWCSVFHKRRRQRAFFQLVAKVLRRNSLIEVLHHWQAYSAHVHAVEARGLPLLVRHNSVLASQAFLTWRLATEDALARRMRVMYAERFANTRLLAAALHRWREALVSQETTTALDSVASLFHRRRVVLPRAISAWREFVGARRARRQRHQLLAVKAARVRARSALRQWADYAWWCADTRARRLALQQARLRRQLARSFRAWRQQWQARQDARGEEMRRNQELCRSVFLTWWQVADHAHHERMVRQSAVRDAAQLHKLRRAWKAWRQAHAGRQLAVATLRARAALERRAALSRSVTVWHRFVQYGRMLDLIARREALHRALSTWRASVHAKHDLERRVDEFAGIRAAVAAHHAVRIWRERVDARRELERRGDALCEANSRALLGHVFSVWHAEARHLQSVRLASAFRRRQLHVVHWKAWSAFAAQQRSRRKRASEHFNRSRTHHLLQRSVFSRWRSLAVEVGSRRAALRRVAARQRLKVLRATIVRWTLFRNMSRKAEDVRHLRASALLQRFWLRWRRQWDLHTTAAAVQHARGRKQLRRVFGVWLAKTNAGLRGRAALEHAEDMRFDRFVRPAFMLWLKATRVRRRVKSGFIRSVLQAHMAWSNKALRGAVAAWKQHVKRRRVERDQFAIKARLADQHYRAALQRRQLLLLRDRVRDVREQREMMEQALQHRLAFVQAHVSSEMRACVKRMRRFAGQQRLARERQHVALRFRVSSALQRWKRWTQRRQQVSGALDAADEQHCRAVLARWFARWKQRHHQVIAAQRVVKVLQLYADRTRMARALQQWRSKARAALDSDIDRAHEVHTRLMRSCVARAFIQWRREVRLARHADQHARRRALVRWHRVAREQRRARDAQVEAAATVRHTRLAKLFRHWSMVARAASYAKARQREGDTQLVVDAFAVWRQDARAAQLAHTRADEHWARVRSDKARAAVHHWVGVVHQRAHLQYARGQVQALRRHELLSRAWAAWLAALRREQYLADVLRETVIRLERFRTRAVFSSWLGKARAQRRSKARLRAALRFRQARLADRRVLAFRAWADFTRRRARERALQARLTTEREKRELAHAFSAWHTRAAQQQTLRVSLETLRLTTQQRVLTAWREFTELAACKEELDQRLDERRTQRVFHAWLELLHGKQRFRASVARVRQHYDTHLSRQAQIWIHSAMYRRYAPLHWAFHVWKRYLQSRRDKQQRIQVATEHARHARLLAAWHQWRECHATASAELLGAQVHSRQVACEAISTWRAWAARKHSQREQSLDALEHWAQGLERTAWDLWRAAFLRAQSFRERIHAFQRRRRHRAVVRAWLTWRVGTHERLRLAEMDLRADVMYSSLLVRKAFYFWLRSAGSAEHVRAMMREADALARFQLLRKAMRYWMGKCTVVQFGRSRLVSRLQGLRVRWQREAFLAWRDLARARRGRGQRFLLTSCFQQWKLYARRRALIRREMESARSVGYRE